MVVNFNVSHTKVDSTNLKLLERDNRIELSALAWKAKVLPLYEPRMYCKLQSLAAFRFPRAHAHCTDASLGGEGWIRTSVLVRGQIYSLLPLTTRPPLLGERKIMPCIFAAITTAPSFFAEINGSLPQLRCASRHWRA